MDNREFGKILEERTKKLAVSVFRLSKSIQYNSENNVVKTQITKSATSIGANYREANRARSNADFLNKIKIAEGEASETVYWLELIIELEIADLQNVEPILKETNEVLAILASAAKKLSQT